MEIMQVIVTIVLVLNAAQVEASSTYMHAGRSLGDKLQAGETAANHRLVDYSQNKKLRAAEPAANQHLVDSSQIKTLQAAESAAIQHLVDSSQIKTPQTAEPAAIQSPIDAKVTRNPTHKPSRLRRSRTYQPTIEQMLTGVSTVDVNDEDKTLATTTELYPSITDYINSTSSCPHKFQVLDLGIAFYPRYLLEADCNCNCEDDSYTAKANMGVVMVMGINSSRSQPALVKVEIATSCYCKPPSTSG